MMSSRNSGGKNIIVLAKYLVKLLSVVSVLFGEFSVIFKRVKEHNVDYEFSKNKRLLQNTIF